MQRACNSCRLLKGKRKNNCSCMANISNPPVLLKSGLLQPDVLSTYEVPVIKIDMLWCFPFSFFFKKPEQLIHCMITRKFIGNKRWQYLISWNFAHWCMPFFRAKTTRQIKFKAVSFRNSDKRSSLGHTSKLNDWNMWSSAASQAGSHFQRRAHQQSNWMCNVMDACRIDLMEAKSY